MALFGVVGFDVVSCGDLEKVGAFDLLEKYS
jgi:hypothetical protein